MKKIAIYDDQDDDLLDDLDDEELSSVLEDLNQCGRALVGGGAPPLVLLMEAS